MTARSCQTCEFFTALHNQCRRDPPKAMIVPGADGQPQVAGIFPAIGPEGWCGQWTPEGDQITASLAQRARHTAN